MAAAILDKYSGKYDIGNGNKIEIKNEDGNLALYFSPGNKFSLYAAGETEFYSNSEFLNLYFKLVNGKIEGFQLERYGNSQFIFKSK